MAEAMILPARLHPEAEAELAEAITWYAGKSIDLAVDFAEAVDEAIAAVRRHPDRYPVVHNEARRFLVRRFPYGVFYQVRPHEIKVLAVYHLHRDPAGWTHITASGRFSGCSRSSAAGAYWPHLRSWSMLVIGVDLGRPASCSTSPPPSPS